MIKRKRLKLTFIAGIISSLLVCNGCDSSNNGDIHSKSLKEEQAPRSLTLEQRLEILSPVIDNFADALANIASKYPEMAGYNKEIAKTETGDLISCRYSHNVNRRRTKGRIPPTYFGENGFTISLVCKAMPLHGQPAYAMAPPTLQLDNLHFYVWTEIETAPNPSPGLLDDVNSIIQTHLDKLREVDRLLVNQSVQ
jgi:hypothetical protein